MIELTFSKQSSFRQSSTIESTSFVILLPKILSMISWSGPLAMSSGNFLFLLLGICAMNLPTLMDQYNSDDECL